MCKMQLIANVDEKGLVEIIQENNLWIKLVM